MLVHLQGGGVYLVLAPLLASFLCQYLNSGPGSVAGFFVHEKHAVKPGLTR